MLIRSQDKKTVFDMTGCTLGVNLENEVYGFGNNSPNEDLPRILGYYKTEQRAIEVLDQICDAYVSLSYFGGNGKNAVYQMPEV